MFNDKRKQGLCLSNTLMQHALFHQMFGTFLTFEKCNQLRSIKKYSLVYGDKKHLYKHCLSLFVRDIWHHNFLKSRHTFCPSGFQDKNTLSMPTSTS